MTSQGKVEKPKNRKLGPQLKVLVVYLARDTHRHWTIGSSGLLEGLRLVAGTLWRVRECSWLRASCSLAGCRAWYGSVQCTPEKEAVAGVAPSQTTDTSQVLLCPGAIAFGLHWHFELKFHGDCLAPASGASPACRLSCRKSSIWLSSSSNTGW